MNVKCFCNLFSAYFLIVIAILNIVIVCVWSNNMMNSFFYEIFGANKIILLLLTLLFPVASSISIAICICRGKISQFPAQENETQSSQLSIQSQEKTPQNSSTTLLSIAKTISIVWATVNTVFILSVYILSSPDMQESVETFFTIHPDGDVAKRFIEETKCFEEKSGSCWMMIGKEIANTFTVFAITYTVMTIVLVGACYIFVL